MNFADAFAILCLAAGSLAIWGIISDHIRRQEESARVWNAIEDINRRLEAK